MAGCEITSILIYAILFLLYARNTNDVMRMAFGSRLNLLLEKVKAVISGQPQNEKEEKTSECLHHFGYLTSCDKDAPIPEECLTCRKMLECRSMSSLASSCAHEEKNMYACMHATNGAENLWWRKR